MTEVILADDVKASYVLQHADDECAGCADEIDVTGNKQFHSAHTEDNGELCVMLKCTVCEGLFCGSNLED